MRWHITSRKKKQTKFNVLKRKTNESFQIIAFQLYRYEHLSFGGEQFDSISSSRNSRDLLLNFMCFVNRKGEPAKEKKDKKQLTVQFTILITNSTIPQSSKRSDNFTIRELRVFMTFIAMLLLTL